LPTRAPAEFLVGLGPRTVADRVVVRRPDRGPRVPWNVEKNRRLEILAPAAAPRPADGDGAVGLADPVIVLAGGGPCSG